MSPRGRCLGAPLTRCHADVGDGCRNMLVSLRQHRNESVRFVTWHASQKKKQKKYTKRKVTSAKSLFLPSSVNLKNTKGKVTYKLCNLILSRGGYLLLLMSILCAWVLEGLAKGTNQPVEESLPECRRPRCPSGDATQSKEKKAPADPRRGLMVGLQWIWGNGADGGGKKV